MNPVGKIIVLSGNSCSGKSTMARLLAPVINAHGFFEPEEAQWPLVAQQWGKYYASTSMLAMRQLWIPLYMDAHALRMQGKTSLIDTYFLKIDGYYIDKPGMEWLVPPTDPYMKPLKEIYALDEQHIPDVDCVVLFDIDFDDWKKFVQERKRPWDKDVHLIETFAPNKKYIEEGTIAHCKKFNIRLVRFKQIFGDPKVQAERLKELLIKEKVI